MTDQAAIELLLRTENNFNIRFEAIRKLKNQSVIADIAKNDVNITGKKVVTTNVAETPFICINV